ncbi:ABC transporter permease [Agaricicola taiwanensis]|uniref:ABC transporter permease n=1 Tax=Agaricicola taiwanensis TaxID=591372 RepID=A0A8J3DXD9_9RHOB|nr:ABC transporter ATP-binding protein [Agaricicola taiwanensis]GGE48168.1 ABC transporter permease [Agaricicola taiwanensis]
MTNQIHDPYVLQIRSTREAAKQPSGERNRLFARFVREFFRPHIATLLVAVGAMIVYAGTISVLPWLFEQLVNEVFVRRAIDQLNEIVAFVAIIFALRGGSAFTQQYLLALVSNRVTAAVQKRFVAHVLKLDLVFFQKNSIGQIVARGTEDVNVLNQSATNLIVTLGRDFVTILGLIGYVIWTNPYWAGLAMLGAPLIAVPTVLATRRVRRLSHRGQELNGDLIGSFEEAFHSIRSIKAEGNEPVEQERLSTTVTTRRQVAIRIARTQATLSPIMDVVTAIALISVLMVGGRSVMTGETEPGQLMAFVGALMLLADPLRRLLQINAVLQLCMAAVERIYEVTDLQPRIIDAPGAAPLADPAGAIAFRDVHFAYDADKPILKGLSADILPGRMTAIVGESGSGKTTLFNLIARLNDPDQGSVEIGGQDLDRVSIANLRASIALVAQDSLLFDATVRENVAYGLLDVDDADILDVLRAADALEFVQRLPGGTDFRVGPRGTRLSGGQRQRIAIARALLRDSPILLLDEATSALDAATEARVLESLAKERAGKTTLMIAHRLAAVLKADRIIAVENGQVVEQGNHAELMSRDGAYARAFRLHAIES